MSCAPARLLVGALLLGALVAPGEARAQNQNTNPELLVVMLAPPALASLVFDVVVTGALVQGSAGRGASVSAMVFGGLTTLFSFLALAIGLSDVNLLTLWVPAGGVGLALGLGSVMLGLYGLVHPPPEPVSSARLATAPPGLFPATARPSGQVAWVPLVWAVRGGVAAGGLVSVSL